MNRKTDDVAFDGKVSEFTFYDRVMTEEEYKQVLEYIRRRYGYPTPTLRERLRDFFVRVIFWLRRPWR